MLTTNVAHLSGYQALVLAILIVAVVGTIAALISAGLELAAQQRYAAEAQERRDWDDR